jgi:hypothetical protein
MAKLLRLLRNTTCPPTIPCFPGLLTPLAGHVKGAESALAFLVLNLPCEFAK